MPYFVIKSATSMEFTCDVCKKCVQTEGPNEQKVIADMQTQDWRIFGTTCICNECIDIHEKVENLFNP